MKDRKVSYNVYAVWEYEKEEEDLNKRSEEGWQLEKGGCFHSVFKRDDTIRYIYQIDYEPDLPDKERYKEIFAETGWEYINSTYNGWHYFKKKYKEGMDIAEEKIYSDKESLYEMQNNYVKMISVFAIMYGLLFLTRAVCSFGRGYSYQDIFHMIGCLIFIFLFGMARISISRERNNQKKIFNIPMKIVFPIGLLIIIISVII